MNRSSGNWLLVFLAVIIMSFYCFPEDVSSLHGEFFEPKPEFSPVPIWWWSGDKVTKDGITWQLKELVKGGIYNAIILNLAPSGPLYGSYPDDPLFLTDEWWDLFAHTLREAKSLGIRIWFYDQLGFSGAGLQAKVVRDNPEFRGVNLKWVVRDVSGPGNFAIELPAEAVSPLALFRAEKISKESLLNRGVPKWIWGGSNTESIQFTLFRRSFNLSTLPKRAEISISCDNSYRLFLNGKQIGREFEFLYDQDGWEGAEVYDVTPYLVQGKNVIAVYGVNSGGPGGLVLRFVADDFVLVSDSQFKVSLKEEENWSGVDFDDSKWVQASEIAELGGGPWGSVRNMGLTADEGKLGVIVKNVAKLPIDTTQKVFNVEIPSGNYELQLFYIVPGGFDYHNPDACKALLNMLHGELERRFPDELGKTIAGSFQDEFPPTPRFSRRLIDEFKTRKGYDILDYLPALIRDVASWEGKDLAPSTVKVRCDSADVASSLAEEAFFIPLEQWHERYGMLCGYDQTVRNADPFRGEEYYVDYFKLMRHYSAPGNDMDGDCKPHQSMADLYSKPRVWIEAFHSSGWGQTIEEIATLLHPWILNGATLFDPHAIYYSIHGSFWEWAPPDTGWRQPYFVHYKVLSDYVARMCWLLSQGKHEVRLAVLHPATTVHAYIGYQLNLPGAKKVADAYWNLQKFLRKYNVDYIILDKDSVVRSNIVEGGWLEVNGVKLHTIVLPSVEYICASVLEKLFKFWRAGGKVFKYGEPLHQIADVVAPTQEQVEWLNAFSSEVPTIVDLDAWAKECRDKVPAWTLENIPTLKRKVSGKPIYFIMSDEGTLPNARARFDINKRNLYEIPSAKGEPLYCSFLEEEGVPEFWDALTGKVETIWNYSIESGMTKAVIDLSETPAPLVSLRPKNEEDLDGIETDLRVLECKQDGGGLKVVVTPFLSKLNKEVEKKSVKVKKGGNEIIAEVEIQPVQEQLFEGPFDFTLIPTCDNKDGSFAYPPSEGPIPVETRAFRGKVEEEWEKGSTDWLSSDFDDSGWEQMIASFGPRARWKGPITLPDGASIDSLEQVIDVEGNWNYSEYSLRLGINEDPVFSSALGGKGRIPEDFIDLGRVKSGQVFHIQCFVELPYDAVGDGEIIKSVLRVGSTAKKKVFLNKIPVVGEGLGREKVFKANVNLVSGVNVLDIFLESIVEDRLRMYFQFLPENENVWVPEWIWSGERSPTGKTRFTKVFLLEENPKSAKMIVALGDVHQIYVNDVKVADQGNFDPYFTSRAEQYDITPHLKMGENRIDIIARDVDSATGLLLDCLVTTAGGKEIFVVSDASFTCKPEGGDGHTSSTVVLLPKPSHGYMGDPALLLVKQRPHPLPFAGWLQDQPPPPTPFDRLVYFPEPSVPKPYRFRFLLPPGAREMIIKSVSQPEIWVNGEKVSVEGAGNTFKVALPSPELPRRIACLRIEGKKGYAKGSLILEPITYRMGEGKIPLGSWDEVGLLHYCGGVEYRLRVEKPSEIQRKVILHLGRVRGTAEVFVNGVSTGVRVWHPYMFDITSALNQPVNEVSIRVFNTLGPHFAIGHPSAHVFENHTKSGIFGPVKVLYVPVVEAYLPL
ncbi:MAG: glycosyl hydrolase [Candidatus Hydrogenedentes bacterium]|nr:glycosyl hydrolase [Candidatus Hydrogenedentota bacterium]